MIDFYSGGPEEATHHKDDNSIEVICSIIKTYHYEKSIL
jgi:hypothetical protein